MAILADLAHFERLIDATGGSGKFAARMEAGAGLPSAGRGGINWDEDEWAMDAIINEVPPGGHHLGSSHTMRHYKTAFYRADLFDYDSGEAYFANGAVDAYERANQKYKQLLREYEQPALDPALDEALRAYIEQRKGELVR